VRPHGDPLLLTPSSTQAYHAPSRITRDTTGNPSVVQITIMSRVSTPVTATTIMMTMMMTRLFPRGGVLAYV
jgi:hypothetical protein